MRGGDNVILRDLAVRFVSVDTQLAEGVGDTTAEHGDEDDHHGQEETWVAEEQRVIILGWSKHERTSPGMAGCNFSPPPACATQRIAKLPQHGQQLAHV